jgi:outer membrane biosynthesis protein TonB
VLFMKHLAISVLLAACATAPSYQHSRDLPRVDRFGTRLVENGIDELTARLRVCVEADGHSHVRLLASSGVSYFDDAVVKDVADWDYPAAETGMCKAFKVRYVPDPHSL